MVFGPQHVLVEYLLALAKAVDLVQQLTNSLVSQFITCQGAAISSFMLFHYSAPQSIYLAVNFPHDVVADGLAFYIQKLAYLLGDVEELLRICGVSVSHCRFVGSAVFIHVDHHLTQLSVLIDLR